MKMSKIIVFAVMFSLTLLNLVAVSEENPNMIYVDDDGTVAYTNIQDAIDAANSGDTVYVYSGIYNENIDVNKTINLIGEDKNTTIIDGNGNGDVLYISADYVNINGFTIQNGGDNQDDAGININSSRTSINDNTIINNSREGILLEYSSNNIISGNAIINNEISMRFAYSHNNIISNNIWLFAMAFSWSNDNTTNPIAGLYWLPPNPY